MNPQQPGNPLHGLTLETLLTPPAELHGWEEPGRLISIKCFRHEPGIRSSLKFPGKTPRARENLEVLYLQDARKTD